MKTAVILMNLGTPTDPTAKAVRRFLKEFLSDRRVIEVPRLIWWGILNGIILPFRAPRVAKSYKSLWDDGGDSPLRLITQKQTSLLQQMLLDKRGDNAPLVEYAMTYCGPSLSDVVERLEEKHVEHISVLPLYPQYSATTTGSIFDQVTKIVTRCRNIPQIHIIKQYFDNPLYIEALAMSVQAHWNKNGRGDHLLMSFHGLPQKYADAGDPYYEQCKKTAELLANKLELADSQWQLSFQSRLGFSKWLSPYTSVVLEQWGKQKIERVDIICPAFAADCLETLEEINIENKEIFLSAGGQQFYPIACLNDQPKHIEMMADIVQMYLPKLSK